MLMHTHLQRTGNQSFHSPNDRTATKKSNWDQIAQKIKWDSNSQNNWMGTSEPAVDSGSWIWVANNMSSNQHFWGQTIKSGKKWAIWDVLNTRQLLNGDLNEILNWHGLGWTNKMISKCSSLSLGSAAAQKAVASLFKSQTSEVLLHFSLLFALLFFLVSTLFCLPYQEGPFAYEAGNMNTEEAAKFTILLWSRLQM